MAAGELKAVGFDPSLRNWGIACAGINLSDWTITPKSVHLVTTQKDSTKKRRSEDDLERAFKLKSGILTYSQDARVIFCEIPTGSQSASANNAFGMIKGILTNFDQPIVQLTPRDIKMASVGHPQATKEEMIQWATDRYPNLNWTTVKRHGVLVPTKTNEHMADAVAAIHAGIESEQFARLVGDGIFSPVEDKS